MPEQTYKPRVFQHRINDNIESVRIHGRDENGNDTEVCFAPEQIHDVIRKLQGIENVMYLKGE